MRLIEVNIIITLHLIDKSLYTSSLDSHLKIAQKQKKKTIFWKNSYFFVIFITFLKMQQLFLTRMHFLTCFIKSNKIWGQKTFYSQTMETGNFLEHQGYSTYFRYIKHLLINRITLYIKKTSFIKNDANFFFLKSKQKMCFLELG